MSLPYSKIGGSRGFWFPQTWIEGQCAWSQAWDGAEGGNMTLLLSVGYWTLSSTCRLLSRMSSPSCWQWRLPTALTVGPLGDHPWCSPHACVHARLCLEIPSQRSQLPHRKSMGLYSKLNGRWLKSFLKPREEDLTGVYRITEDRDRIGGPGDGVGLSTGQLRWRLELG